MYMSVCLFCPKHFWKLSFFSGQIYIGLKRALLLCKTFLTSGYCQSVLIDLLSSIRLVSYVNFDQSETELWC